MSRRARGRRRRGTVLALDVVVVASVVFGAGALVAGRMTGRPAAPARTAGRFPTAATSHDAARMSPEALPFATPVRLSIPAIGVRTPLERLGLNADGTPEVPASFSTAGWYDLGPSPGQPGAAVLLGHVDSTAGPAIFYRVGSLPIGSRVDVTRADGTVAEFRVYAVREYPKTSFPTTTVYGGRRRPELRLVTCGGAFDGATGHYVDNVVAFARYTGTR